MGHGGESTVCSPQHHQTSNHYPHVGGSASKKPHSLTNMKTNISGGGISHNHDNSKGSSKSSKKSHAHSTPQGHAKPSGKGRQCQGKVEYSSPPNGNNANLVALQNFQQQQTQFHAMKHPLPAHSRGQLNAATTRQKSFSPPTLHPMPSREANARTTSPVLPGSKNKEHFYAGARFETHPSHIGLPVPPSHWTAPLQRSQSQPSSPIPSSLPQKGISVDLATLFGYSDSTFKSASFPGVRLMDALVKMEEKKKDMDNVSVGRQSFGSQAQVTDYERSADETDELKKALGLTASAAKLNKGGFNSRGSDMSPAKYQDISDQLKNLLKVAA